MISLPSDRRSELFNKVLDVWNGCKTLSEFQQKVIEAFPNDPTYSVGFFVGEIVGKMVARVNCADLIEEKNKELIEQIVPWGNA